LLSVGSRAHGQWLLLWQHPWLLGNQVRKPSMLQGIMSTNPQLWAHLQHPLKQINSQWVNLWQDNAQILCGIHLEVLLVFAVLRDIWPGTFGRRAHDAENAHELILVRRSGEEWPSSVHLGHHTTCRPYVDAGVVGAGSEEDVGGAVPERNDFIREGVYGNAECSRQTEISELELALGVDEEILGLEITVQDSVGVAEIYALEELVHE